MATEVRDETLVFWSSDFLGWLDTKEDGAVLGLGCDVETGPLVRWLNETRPAPKPWWVGWSLVGYDAYHYTLLPVWMVLFTRRLAHLYGKQTVSVLLAKEVLAEVLG